ncbi:hypothetical protein QBC39DRAFT_433799 [Podospora conica]|nr:hypothetical protein QBC39DRAFT_433799 [Schizothecium conicum]
MPGSPSDLMEDQDLWGDNFDPNLDPTLYQFDGTEFDGTNFDGTNFDDGNFDQANFEDFMAQQLVSPTKPSPVSPRAGRRSSQRLQATDTTTAGGLTLPLPAPQPQWTAQAPQAPGPTEPTTSGNMQPPVQAQGDLGHSHGATANSYLPGNSSLLNFGMSVPGVSPLPPWPMPALPMGGPMPTFPMGGGMPTLPMGGHMPPLPMGGPRESLPMGEPMPPRLLGTSMPPPPSAEPSLSPSRRSPTLKSITHARKTKNRPDNDPSALYARLPPQPKWGPTKGRTKAPLFDYYKGGPELYPSKRFSKEELWTFFIGAGRPVPRQGMTIWIQSTPSQVNDRYQAQSASSKCRYKDCPVPKGTILKGFYRVAMDEFADLTTEGAADPFHNAGYLHLYCFEQIFDLGLLLHTAHAFYGFKVAADVRNHRYEDRNPMAITHHHKDLGAIFSQWKQSHQERACAIWPTARDPDSGGRQPRANVHRRANLWYALTRAQLSLEVKNRRPLREKRGGANLERHRGDLTIFLGIKQDMKAKARAGAADDSDDDAEEQGPAPRLSWSTSAHSTSDTPSPPPAANQHKRKRPVPIPQPINTELASEFNPDSSWLIQRQQHQLSPQDEIRRLSEAPGRITTRKRSREAAAAIVQAVATTPHITRQQTAEISGLLAQQPRHVQEQIIVAVTPVRPEFLLFDDELEERVGRLAKRQRREVSGFVAKREMGGDSRRVHSYV